MAGQSSNGLLPLGLVQLVQAFQDMLWEQDAGGAAAVAAAVASLPEWLPKGLSDLSGLCGVASRFLKINRHCSSST